MIHVIMNLRGRGEHGPLGATGAGSATWQRVGRAALPLAGWAGGYAPQKGLV